MLIISRIFLLIVVVQSIVRFIQAISVGPNECLVASAGPQGLGSNLFQLTHLLAHFNNCIPENKTLFWDYSAAVYTCCPTCPNNGWDDIFMDSAMKLHACVRPAPLKWTEQRGNDMIQFDYIIDTERNLTKHFNCKKWNFLTVDIYNRQAYKWGGEDTCSRMIKSIGQLWQPTRYMQDIIYYELENLKLYPQPLIAIHVRGGLSFSLSLSLCFSLSQSLSGDKLGTELLPDQRNYK